MTSDTSPSQGEDIERAAELSEGSPSSSFAWMVLIVAFISMIVCWGAWYSFGVFLKPLLDEFGWTRAMVTGPTVLFHLFHGFFSIYSGRLVDRFGPKKVIPLFGALMGAGFISVSQATKLWHFYLSYGLIAGIGSAVVYVPYVTTVSYWFVKRRGMMLGILVSGIGAGMMLVPLVIQVLISYVGWRQSYLLLGLSLCFVTVSGGLLLKLPFAQRQTPQRGAGPFKWVHHGLEGEEFSLPMVLKRKTLWILFFGYFSVTLCTAMIATHIVIHAMDLRISASAATTLLTVMGASSIFGKVAIGAISDKIGRVICLVGTLALLGLSLTCLPIITGLPKLYVFAAVFGTAYGGYVPVIPAIIGEMFGIGNLGTVLGIVIVGASLGSSIGPVLGGYIFDMRGSYDLAFWLAATFAFLTAFASTRLRQTSTRVQMSNVPSR